MLLALVALLVPATAAFAATRTGEPSTAVAFTAPGGDQVTLSVQAADPGLICRDLTVGSETFTDETCSEPPLIAADELIPVEVRTAGVTVVYGMTRRATRGVDLVVDGKRQRLETVAVEGFGARFWATAYADDAVLGAIALRDRTGKVTAAADLERAALPLAGRVRRVAMVRDLAGRERSLYALAPRVLANPQRNPSRRRVALCVALGGDSGKPSVVQCAQRRKQVRVTYQRTCKDPRLTVYGVAPAFVRRAVAVFADGERLDLDVHRVPRAVRRRGVVLSGARDGDAVLRRVQVFNKAGTRLGTFRVRRASCG